MDPQTDTRTDARELAALYLLRHTNDDLEEGPGFVERNRAVFLARSGTVVEVALGGGEAVVRRYRPGPFERLYLRSLGRR